MTGVSLRGLLLWLAGCLVLLVVGIVSWSVVDVLSLWSLVGGAIVVVIVMLWVVRVERQRREQERELIGLWRSTRHTLFNHLQVISGWVQLERGEKAQAYIESVRDRLTAQRKAMEKVDPVLMGKLIGVLDRVESAGIFPLLEVRPGFVSDRVICERLAAVLGKVIDELSRGTVSRKRLLLEATFSGDNGGTIRIVASGMSPVVEDDWGAALANVQGVSCQVSQARDRLVVTASVRSGWWRWLRLPTRR